MFTPFPYASTSELKHRFNHAHNSSLLPATLAATSSISLSGPSPSFLRSTRDQKTVVEPSQIHLGRRIPTVNAEEMLSGPMSSPNLPKDKIEQEVEEMMRDVHRRREEKTKDHSGAKAHSRKRASASTSSWYEVSFVDLDDQGEGSSSTHIESSLPPPSPRPKNRRLSKLFPTPSLKFALSSEASSNLDAFSLGPLMVAPPPPSLSRSSSSGSKPQPKPQPPPHFDYDAAAALEFYSGFGALTVGSQMVPLSRCRSSSSSIRSRTKPPSRTMPLPFKPQKAGRPRAASTAPVSPADIDIKSGPVVSPGVSSSRRTPPFAISSSSTSTSSFLRRSKPASAQAPTPLDTRPTHRRAPSLDIPSPSTSTPQIIVTPIDSSDVDSDITSPGGYKRPTRTSTFPSRPSAMWFLSEKHMRRKSLRLTKAFGEGAASEGLVHANQGVSNVQPVPLDRPIRREASFDSTEESIDPRRRSVMKLSKTFGEDIPPMLLLGGAGAGARASEPEPFSLPPPPSSWLSRSSKLIGRQSPSLRRTHQPAQSESHSNPLTVHVTKNIFSSFHASSGSLSSTASSSKAGSSLSADHLDPRRSSESIGKSNPDPARLPPPSSIDEHRSVPVNHPKLTAYREEEAPFSNVTNLEGHKLDHRLPSFFDDSDEELETRQDANSYSDCDSDEYVQGSTAKTTPASGPLPQGPRALDSNISLELFPIPSPWSPEHKRLRTESTGPFGRHDVLSSDLIHLPPLPASLRNTPSASAASLLLPSSRCRLVRSTSDGIIYQRGTCRRKERRQGWSGEWNRERMQDAIDKLRVIK